MGNVPVKAVVKALAEARVQLWKTAAILVILKAAILKVDSGAPSFQKAVYFPSFFRPISGYGPDRPAVLLLRRGSCGGIAEMGYHGIHREQRVTFSPFRPRRRRGPH